MSTVRRFLAIQALSLWQGGFLFYAAVVVPTGTHVLGTFEQGRVTREVTVAMNWIGAATLVILAWDQVRYGDSSRFRRTRWVLWGILVGGLATLMVLHPKVDGFVDLAGGRILEYPAFYHWHRIYLYAATAQWLVALIYVAVMVRAWRNHPVSQRKTAAGG